MTTYNAAAWLLDRRIEAGDGGRTAYVVDGRDDRLRARCNERCSAPSGRSRRSTSDGASGSR